MEPRCARVACLLVAAGLAGPAAAVAPARTPPAQDVWNAYPLRQAQQPAASTGAEASDTAAAPSQAVERLALASVLALIAGGLIARLATSRWPRARAGSRAGPPAGALDRSTSRELWVHAADAAPPPPDAERPPLPAPSSSPPEPDRAWKAEIGWRLVDGESQFSIAARPMDGGAEPITLGASSPLEWPPRGARSVQALADAVKALESTLVAAGWTPLPRGGAWYAKRFAWQPGARSRP